MEKVKIKLLSLELVKHPESRPEIVYHIKETDYDRFYIEKEMLESGQRYLVMTSAECIMIAQYACESAYRLYTEYGMDIEPLLFEKMREELGFKRKF